VNLRGADLRGIAAGSGHFEWAIFEDANLQTAYFYRTYLSHAIFIDAKGSVLPVPKLTQPTSIMTGAVQSAKLPQSCDIPDPTRSVPRVASFPLADLSNAKFDSSHFEGAAFDHSILSNTSFHGCPVKSRTESTGCLEQLSRSHSQASEVPVKWGFSRIELG